MGFQFLRFHLIRFINWELMLIFLIRKWIWLVIMQCFFTFKCYANFDKIGARFICDSDYCSRQIGALLRYSLPKIQQTKMLVTCQRFWDLFLFGLVWQYSSVQTKYNKGRLKVMATYLQQKYSFEPTFIHWLCFEERAKFL